jgi:hypothetical protein
MAQNKSNWIWWTLGGVSVIGLGVGAYIYFKNKPKNGGEQSTPPPAEATPTIQNIVNTVATALSPTPFKNQAEGDRFRGWVNDKYPNYAREIDLDRSWKEFDNSTIRKAWAKYGEEYKASGSGQVVGNTQTGMQVLTNQMKSSGFMPTIEDGSRSQFTVVDRTGPNNILANFTPNGYFWIELPALVGGGQKFDGTWNYLNGQFTLKLNDNSFNANDNEINEMVKQVVRLKFPNDASSLNFTDSGTKSNLEGMMHGGRKNYVDTHDSML